MGSYCGVTETKSDNFFYANHKFFGYIENTKIQTLSSFKYLVSLCENLKYLLNITYIGRVIRLTPKETTKFMKLYANDYGCDFKEMWGVDLSDLKIKNECFISFD